MFSCIRKTANATLTTSAGLTMATMALLSLLFSFSLGCAKHTLDPLSPATLSSVVTSDVQVNFCTDPAYNPPQYLKMLILLDHSGSNQLNYQMNPNGTGTPNIVGGQLIVGTQYATDPTGKTRYGNVATPGTLLNYLANIPANDPTNPTRFFALVDFNGGVQTAYPAGGSGFTSDTTAFFNFVQADATAGAGGAAPSDGGDTDYLAALNQAYSIINGDIHSAQTCAALPLGSASPGAWCPNPGVAVASSYVLVFMSDGAPITAISGVTVEGGQYVVTGTFSYTLESPDNILAEVASIVDLSQNSKFVTSVNMFTIYYYAAGNIDTTGEALLSEMAQAGNGIAYGIQSGTNINYNAFQPATKQVTYTLGDVFVTNSSVTWWNDGQLHQDTDRDGLPDDIETAWGTNPKLRSTANNGVSDLVRYQVAHGAPCTNKGANGICLDAVTNYAAGGALCQNIQHSTVAGVLTYKSSDPDGLNDCEKLILNDQGGINNPDSNGDLLPDWLEFLAGVPFQIGAAPAVNSPDQDGYTVYQKVKYSLPQNIPIQQELNLNPASYDLNLVSSKNSQECYQLTVSNLPTLGPDNMVRVDVIEKSSALNQPYLYRVGKKPFPGNTLSLQFNDWTDPGEIAAGTWQVWP